MRELLLMRALRFLSCVLVLGCNANAQTTCSLIVHAVNPDGVEVDAKIKVEEPDGRTIEKENDVGGSRFCDLGILPVTVTVGDLSCNGVVVHNVLLRWGKTTNLKVVYDIEPCIFDPPPLPKPLCVVLFRFVGNDGQGVSGVSVVFQSGLRANSPADDFGRLLISLGRGQEIRGAVSAQGYRAAQLSASCGDSIQQHTIVMQPVGGAAGEPGSQQ